MRSEVYLGRDRAGLESRQEAGEAIYPIWANAIRKSSKARELYIALLLDHENCLDVEDLSSNIEKDCADLLFRALRDLHPNTFIYYAEETTNAIRIIRDSLKKEPFLITKPFFEALRKHETILTPEEARKRAFLAMPEAHPEDDDDISTSHTIHVMRAFMKLDSDMAPFASCWSFKACDHSVGPVNLTVDDGHVYLNDQLLDPSSVHQSRRWEACPIARHSLKADGRTTACDCPALNMLGYITDELHDVSGDTKEDLKVRRIHLLQQMPRSLQIAFKIPVSDSPNITSEMVWTTHLASKPPVAVMITKGGAKQRSPQLYYDASVPAVETSEFPRPMATHRIYDMPYRLCC